MSAAREQRLRLRLRIMDSPVRAKVNVPATCTLEQLKAAVRAELPGLDAEYGLSFNKKVSAIAPHDGVHWGECNRGPPRWLCAVDDVMSFASWPSCKGQGNSDST